MHVYGYIDVILQVLCSIQYPAMCIVTGTPFESHIELLIQNYIALQSPALKVCCTDINLYVRENYCHHALLPSLNVMQNITVNARQVKNRLVAYCTEHRFGAISII